MDRRVKQSEHTPETDEYGISSFVFKVINLLTLIDFGIISKINFQQILLEVKVYFG